MIRDCIKKDAKRLCEIYNYYVKNTFVTFETEGVKVNEMSDRIVKAGYNCPWIVYEENEVIGYSYASQWKPRGAYKFTVESSIYVDHENKGQGIGKKLYTELINRLSKMSVHSIISGIALPNDESIAFHEKFGFEKVAHFKEVGYKFNKWIDVGYWELIFD